MNKTEIIHRLSLFKQDYDSKYTIKRLGLFGSYARNEQRPYSDIDVAIQLENATLFDLANIEIILRERISEKVNVTSINRFTNPDFLQEINKDIIYV